MKVGLFLMTYKGYRVLQSVIESGFASHIGFVCIGKDANVGNDYSGEIEQCCLRHNIVSIEAKDAKQYAATVDYSIAISWRWMLDPENLIVLHDSLLPKYRGFAPLVNMLKNGEARIGVTAIFAGDEYDKGDIIAQSGSDISYPIKIEQAIETVTANYIEVVEFIFETITAGKKLQGKAQIESDATYSLWLDDRDYKIDWQKDSGYIKRFIDAVGFPFHGAFSIVNDEKIVIREAETLGDVAIENRDVGKIIYFHEKFPVVVCGSGLLKITDAVYDGTQESIFPLKKFRLRFE
ncbi:MAG: methionyl-tRNA formyltransferase [Flavobacterium sp.]|nr:MAG: methionyl-tRNA formyltransferase [Flavobacterium sp.]